MRNFITVFSLFSLLFLGSCVEKSEKYKLLQARLDSLQVDYQEQNTEMESVLAGLNEISAGMQAIREAEHLLALETQKDQKGNSSKAKIASLKEDITAINGAIIGYKEQIAKLENNNKRQSAEFRKMIAGLNEELEKRAEKISEIGSLLAEREKELGFKNQQIADLNLNVETLQEESIQQKELISSQDQNIHQAHYLLGNRKNLKEADVISRKGIFCPPIVSSQARLANFVTVDIRELKSIPLNTKKAKILSTHPEGSYSIENSQDGMQTLAINDANAFWQQTKYLVVMINE